MWIMIAGSYTSGANSDAERQSNLDAMNKAALKVFGKGHLPIIGVNLALPITKVAGDEKFDEIMMPVSLGAAERCDACLRIGGLSTGADQEMEKCRARGLEVYWDVNDVPEA